MTPSQETTIIQPALLPCPNPWCAKSNPQWRLVAGYVKIECFTCRMGAPLCDTEAEAVSAWNTRPAQPALVELAWMIRLNLENEDRRMAVENTDALISLLETGERPNDLPSARKLASDIQAALLPDEGGNRGRMRLVREVGASVAQPAPVEQDVERAKAQSLLDTLAGWSDSEFAMVAMGDDGEELLSRIVGTLANLLNSSTLTPARAEGFKAGVEACKNKLKAIGFNNVDAAFADVVMESDHG